CVLVHGFTGSPDEVMPLAAALQQAGYEVALPVLEGHGADKQQLRTATANAWLQSVLAYLKPAVGKRPVHLIGFSMGAMLCAVLARRQPVSSLTMIAPAVYYSSPTQVFRQIASVIKEAWAGGASAAALRQRIDKIANTPLESLRQFRRAVQMGKAALPYLTLPVCVLQGDHDELVEPRSGPYVYRTVASRYKELHMLPGAGHMICCQGEEVADVCRIVLNFLQKANQETPDGLIWTADSAAGEHPSGPEQE
ncbi:MAG: alpha/beta fold hydrolase, partial [Alicyclobacillus sp.]|nr:alpha/beta fold hydrolase [Alicyclobacillus sp.]